MKYKQFLEASASYFAGAFSMIDDELPDGAFLQVHIDDAEYLINDPECVKDIEGITHTRIPKDIDGHDIAMYYMEHHKHN